SDSFQHFSSRLQGYANGKNLKKESDYWKNVAKAEVRFLPRKKEINRDTFENSKTLSVKLDSNKTDSLLREANRAYNTEINDILLTSLLV
ncbi:condensation domain-containing protein, partial [Bacillus sp. SIMBA_154]